MSIKNDPKLESVYVTLDALLDTRLGTVAKINQDIANKLAISDSYHKRDQDVFEGIDVSEYKRLYKDRDVETLALSIVTNVVTLIKKIVSGLAEQAIKRPFHNGGKVVVNYYPYKLSEEEQVEIGKAIAIWVKGTAPVELVNIPDSALTPEYCRDNFALMIMYDYAPWLDLHAESFKKVQIPNLTLFAPAIYFEKKPTDEELKRLVSESMHPFEGMTFLVSTIMDLQLLDAKVFSILSD